MGRDKELCNMETRDAHPACANMTQLSAGSQETTKNIAFSILNHKDNAKDTPGLEKRRNGRFEVDFLD